MRQLYTQFAITIHQDDNNEQGRHAGCQSRCTATAAHQSSHLHVLACWRVRVFMLSSGHLHKLTGQDPTSGQVQVPGNGGFVMANLVASLCKCCAICYHAHSVWMYACVTTVPNDFDVGYSKQCLSSNPYKMHSHAQTIFIARHKHLSRVCCLTENNKP
jgi:hypothetical protein